MVLMRFMLILGENDASWEIMVLIWLWSVFSQREIIFHNNIRLFFWCSWCTEILKECLAIVLSYTSRAAGLDRQTGHSIFNFGHPDYRFYCFCIQPVAALSLTSCHEHHLHSCFINNSMLWRPQLWSNSISSEKPADKFDPHRIYL